MASDVVETTAAKQEAPPPPNQPRGQLYFFRFYAVYVVLALALCAAAAGVVVAARSSGGSASVPAWSKWHPAGTGLRAASEIARHVGGEYRLQNEVQFVDVLAKAPSVAARGQTFPVGYVAIQGAASSDRVYNVSGGNSVMYTLCGQGASCTLATGALDVPSGLLVRREVLELALYTFRYERGIDDVIAFLPPSSATAAATIVYLQRGDVGAELRTPLGRTLGERPSVTSMSAHKVKLIDSATGKRTYSFSLERAQDGNALLILTPVHA